MKKKLLRMALLSAAFAGLLCVSALADDITAGGFYDIGTAANVKIEATASSGTVSKTSADVDRDGKYETFYANSDKLSVTYSGAMDVGDQFVVLLVSGSDLPTAADQIYYIDQAAKETGNITFDVYPMLPTAMTQMTLYITSDRAGFTTIKIPLNYAVSGNYDVAPYTLGDVNRDGVIDPNDALLVLQYNAELISLDSTQQAAANVTLPWKGDNTIDPNDALRILQYNAELIHSWDENN